MQGQPFDWPRIDHSRIFSSAASAKTQAARSILTVTEIRTDGRILPNAAPEYGYRSRAMVKISGNISSKFRFVVDARGQPSIMTGGLLHALNIQHCNLLCASGRVSCDLPSNPRSERWADATRVNIAI